MDINIMDFIVQECLWLIPVLMVIGYVLKQIPNFPDWCIPIGLYIIGLGLGYAFIAKSSVGLLQGLLCATAAIGFHQGIKQNIKKDI